MADKHPYTPAPGYLVQVLTHLRKSFPTTVTAETLRKLGFAPKNESYILNILRFLNLIDEEGKKTDVASKTFNAHDDTTFSQEFSKHVKKSYGDLFVLHGEGSWDVNPNSLITFFRSTDGTTALVGKLQATTFRLLAAFAGHGDMPAPKEAGSKAASSASKRASKKDTDSAKKLTPGPTSTSPAALAKEPRQFGMTVRIEINLPADGNQETYDRIFKSIRENFLNA